MLYNNEQLDKFNEIKRTKRMKFGRNAYIYLIINKIKLSTDEENYVEGIGKIVSSVYRDYLRELHEDFPTVKFINLLFQIDELFTTASHINNEDFIAVHRQIIKYILIILNIIDEFNGDSAEDHYSMIYRIDSVRKSMRQILPIKLNYHDRLEHLVSITEKNMTIYLN